VIILCRISIKWSTSHTITLGMLTIGNSLEQPIREVLVVTCTRMFCVSSNLKRVPPQKVLFDNVVSCPTSADKEQYLPKVTGEEYWFVNKRRLWTHDVLERVIDLTPGAVVSACHRWFVPIQCTKCSLSQNDHCHQRACWLQKDLEHFLRSWVPERNVALLVYDNRCKPTRSNALPWDLLMVITNDNRAGNWSSHFISKNRSSSLPKVTGIAGMTMSLASSPPNNIFTAVRQPPASCR